MAACCGVGYQLRLAALTISMLFTLATGSPHNALHSRKRLSGESVHSKLYCTTWELPDDVIILETVFFLHKKCIFMFPEPRGHNE